MPSKGKSKERKTNMKKLMIAAAAAAMIGGAYADLAYNFTANLKTTVGKGGKQGTVKVNLGMDDVGTFWYEDAAVTDVGYSIKYDENTKKYRRYWDAAKVWGDAIDTTDLKTVKGRFADVNCNGYLLEAVISVNEGKINLVGKLNSNFDALQDFEKALFAGTVDAKTYNNKSDGKWCASYSYKDGAECYRAAGSKKLTDVLFVDDCCAEEYVGDTYTVGFPLNNRFGATTHDKATKVEVCGYVNDFCDAVSADQLTLAGQGTWKDKLVKIDGEYVAGISSISGNIVGALTAPDCESCCENPTEAIAWACDDAVEDETLPTAAFGSWSLKFNSKESN